MPAASSDDVRQPTAGGAPDIGLAYLERLHAAFDEATAAPGALREHDVVVAGARVRLRFAGRALEPAVLPALAHHVRPRADEPVATLDVWDSLSTGVPLPPVPWPRAHVDGRWHVRGLNDDRVRTISNPDAGIVTMFDAAAARGVWWSPSPAGVPWYDRAAPLRPVFHWVLTRDDRRLLHAGGVGGAGGALLLVGRGGSGKSTTAVRCLEAGFTYLGDDYVVLTGHERPLAHNLYGTAKLTPHGLSWAPRLGRATLNPERGPEDKVVVDVGAVARERVVASAAVRAVVVPALTGAATSSLRPVGALAALRALAPSTLLQHPEEAQAGLRAMGSLVRSVPCFTLELGRDDDPTPLLRELVE